MARICPGKENLYSFAQKLNMHKGSQCYATIREKCLTNIDRKVPRIGLQNHSDMLD